MNEAACVVGIDVSKRKLDIALLFNGKRKSKVFDNTATGHASEEAAITLRGECSNVPVKSPNCSALEIVR